MARRTPAPALDHPVRSELPALPNDTLRFMRWLWAVDHGLQSVSKRMQKTVGLTGPQRLIVRVLGRRPNLSAGELSATLHLHPSTLTGILKRLDDLGVISRRPAPGDRRRVVLTLTPRGKAFDCEREGTVEDIVRRALAPIPSDAIAAAADVLAQIASALARPVGVPRAKRPHGRPAR